MSILCVGDQVKGLGGGAALESGPMDAVILSRVVRRSERRAGPYGSALTLLFRLRLRLASPTGIGEHFAASPRDAVEVRMTQPDPQAHGAVAQ